MEIKIMCVLGAGLMGSGIARICARAGRYGWKTGRGVRDYK